MHYRLIETPFGFVGILFKEDKAIRILLPRSRSDTLDAISYLFPGAVEDRQGMGELANLLAGFLKGENILIPMDFVDKSIVSPFQMRVLVAERSIPRGMAASYSWLARTAGSNAIRAAGSALARNPWPFVIPCHRTIRMDRTIGNYQGGSEMKRRLLEMEGVLFEPTGKVSRECFLK